MPTKPKRRPMKAKRRPKPKAPKATGIAHSLQAWATGMGAERRTLEAQLVKSGYIRKGKGEKIPFRAIYVAIIGDKEAEQVRKLRGENDDADLARRKRAGELVDRAMAEKHIAELFTLPLGQALAALPSVVDVQVNPGDPATARAVLERHVEEIKKQIRDGLPKGETK